MSQPDSALNLNVRYVAELARLRLEDHEVATFQPQLEKILGFVEQLKSVDVTGVEPTYHAVPLTNVLRADEPGACLDPDRVLANAPARVNGLFQVPPVIDS